MKHPVARLTRSPLLHRIDVDASSDRALVALCGREGPADTWFIAPDGTEADCRRCVCAARARQSRVVEAHYDDAHVWRCPFGHETSEERPCDCAARGFRCTCCGEVCGLEDVRDELCPACAGLCVACGEHQGAEETGYGEPICSGCAERDWLSARAGTEPARFAALRAAAPEVFAEEEDLRW